MAGVAGVAGGADGACAKVEEMKARPIYWIVQHRLCHHNFLLIINAMQECSGIKVGSHE